MINRKKSIENHQKVLKDAQLLYNDVEVNKIISDIGKAITNELKTSNPIVMPVMIGGLIFAGKLIQKLDFPLQIDYIHATRYSGDTHGGKLNWLKKIVSMARLKKFFSMFILFLILICRLCGDTDPQAERYPTNSA